MIILCALAVAVSMTLLTIGRRLMERGRIPSNLTYRVTFVNPHLRVLKPNLTTAGSSIQTC